MKECETLKQLVKDLEEIGFFETRKIGGDGNYKEISDKLEKGRINHKIFKG